MKRLTDEQLAELETELLARPPCSEDDDPLRDGLLALLSEVRALRASVSGAPALAPWYEADGSTVMLPAAEVERRRKLAAKVIGAARNWREAMRGPKSERAARGLKERGTELLATLRALDAPAPGSDDGARDAGEGTKSCACGKVMLAWFTGAHTRATTEGMVVHMRGCCTPVPAAGEPGEGEAGAPRSDDGSGKGGATHD